jgi:ribosomal protein L3 glutamine methyltransferase
MTQAKTTKKQTVFEPRSVATELFTVCDYVRYAVSRFTDSGLAYGHGTDNALDEAVFLVLESLHLPIDSVDPYWTARLTTPERLMLAERIERRIAKRIPAPYLVNKAYIQGYPFYVDERVIVPRSFIAEILCDENGFSQIPEYAGVTRVLDLCTGSGCLAIIAAHLFPNATLDAVDLSDDALAVAARNVSDHALDDRVTLYKGDLFAPLSGKQYDLILTNPPYVDLGGMNALPPEFRHEPAMALGAGKDGMEIVHRIMKDAKKHLSKDGGMICELGRCAPLLEAAYPDKPFLWLETANSDDEVFWISQKDL